MIDGVTLYACQFFEEIDAVCAHGESGSREAIGIENGRADDCYTGDVVKCVSMIVRVVNVFAALIKT